mmetsp:Transcript_13006/g.52397  ORF Transcript_13006/g.52397 Transcript_13006/m.52397 type:complete len:397 (-) Transcript_13006:2062-3252(-)
MAADDSWTKTPMRSSTVACACASAVICALRAATSSAVPGCSGTRESPAAADASSSPSFVAATTTLGSVRDGPSTRTPPPPPPPRPISSASVIHLGASQASSSSSSSTASIASSFARIGVSLANSTGGRFEGGSTGARGGSPPFVPRPRFGATFSSPPSSPFLSSIGPVGSINSSRLINSSRSTPPRETSHPPRVLVALARSAGSASSARFCTGFCTTCGGGGFFGTATSTTSPSPGSSLGACASMNASLSSLLAVPAPRLFRGDVTPGLRPARAPAPPPTCSPTSAMPSPSSSLAQFLHAVTSSPPGPFSRKFRSSRASAAADAMASLAGLTLSCLPSSSARSIAVPSGVSVTWTLSSSGPSAYSSAERASAAARRVGHSSERSAASTPPPLRLVI